MKRKLIWMPVGIATFFIGVAAFLFFQFSPTIDRTLQEVVTVSKYSDCLPSPRFPGKSIEISSVQMVTNEYFPSEAYGGKWSGREAFINKWYGKHLYSMDEESLIHAYDPDTEVYRFLWLRTFHHPVTVRVEKTMSGARLIMKETNGAGGYDAGRVISSRQIALTKDEWCTFSYFVDQANFWNESLEKDDLGADGAKWILEGVRRNRYHAVDRFSPSDGNFRATCIYLLELAGIETAKLGDELY